MTANPMMSFGEMLIGRMDEVMRCILRENPKLNPRNKRDQNVIARLLDERLKKDNKLRKAMAITTMGGLILEQKTKH